MWETGLLVPILHSRVIFTHPYPCHGLGVGHASSLSLDFGCSHGIYFDKWDVVNGHDENKGLE